MPKKNGPGKCYCCAIPPCPVCLRVVACSTLTTGERFPITGATVSITEFGKSTVLDSGLTNSAGEFCSDKLGPQAAARKDLQYTVSYRPTDYRTASAIIRYPWCGTTTVVGLDPGVDGVSGTYGNLSVTLRRNDGSLVTSGQSRIYRPTNLVFPVATSNHNALGIATFFGLPVGEPLLFNSGPTSGASQNFPQFTLTCEGSAQAKEGDEFSVGQTWSFTSIPCNAGDRACCETCFPDTLPATLTLTDPAGRVGTILGACSFVSRTVALTYSQTWDFGWQCNGGNGAGWGFRQAGAFGEPPIKTQYVMRCTPTGPTLHFLTRMDACTLPTGCPPSRTCTCRVALDFCAGIPATSYTCDPFAATFDVPARTYDCVCESIFDIGPGTRPACGPVTVPAHTITITE